MENDLEIHQGELGWCRRFRSIPGSYTVKKSCNCFVLILWRCYFRLVISVWLWEKARRWGLVVGGDGWPLAYCFRFRGQGLKSNHCSVRHFSSPLCFIFICKCAIFASKKRYSSLRIIHPLLSLYSMYNQKE